MANKKAAASKPSESIARSRIVGEIEEERLRQVTKFGYDANHDDAHVGGELAEAAACYAASAANNGHIYTQDRPGNGTLVFSELWPFEFEYDKRDSHDKRRLLIQAGAFIVAEIERLDRAEHQRDVMRQAGKAGKPVPKGRRDDIGMYRG